MFRSLFLVLTLTACGSRAPAPQAPRQPVLVGPQTPRPWPADGLCLNAYPGCHPFSAAEVDAVKAAVLAYLTPERVAGDPVLQRARELASWPISAPNIGGYRLYVASQPDYDYMLYGSSVIEDNGQQVIEIRLKHPDDGAWTVVSVDQRFEPALELH